VRDIHGTKAGLCCRPASVTVAQIATINMASRAQPVDVTHGQLGQPAAGKGGAAASAPGSEAGDGSGSGVTGDGVGGGESSSGSGGGDASGVTSIPPATFAGSGSFTDAAFRRIAFGSVGSPIAEH
jgi:hypothetical protein